MVINPFQGKEHNVLSEPNEKLPHAIRGMTSLGRGNKLYLRLENTSEDDQVLNPEWEIGTAEIVEEELDLPRTEIEEVGLPSVPEDLSPKKIKGNWRPYSRSIKIKMCSLGRGSN